MASKNRTTLKGFFETGDTPSEAQYADLIDSNLNLSETTAQQVSSDIHTSDTIMFNNSNTSGITYADSTGNVRYGLQFSRTSNLVSLTNNAANGFVQIKANGSSAGSGGEVTSSIFTSYSNEFLMPITASGNISSSGTVITNEANIIGHITASGNISSSGEFIGASANITNITSSGNLTITGNISASNTSTASFGSAILSNLPTTTPTTTGSLWLSGSNAEGTSKHLMVFTG